MYTSDYGFAAGSTCYLNKTLSFYHENGCASNNWLYLGGDEWLLSQHSAYDFVSHCISNIGAVGFSGSGGNAIKVRPVFYLNANVSFVDLL